MTDRLREAATAALEALEALQGGCTDSEDGTVEALTVWCPEVVDDLRAALAVEQITEALRAERDALRARNKELVAMICEVHTTLMPTYSKSYEGRAWLGKMAKLT
jgi:anion-transporting  ArsA/GET3 family ATPase